MNRITTLLLALLLVPCLTFAQDCQQVSFPTELNNRIFMLSSTNENGIELFLSSNADLKKGKLDAVKAEAGSKSLTYKATDNLLWRIEAETESQVRLYSIGRDAYLVHNSNKLGLAFSETKTAQSLWNVENHNGTMALVPLNGDSRTLSLTSLVNNQMHTDKGVFDNYAKTYNANYGFRLYFYGTQPAQGSCTMPTQGARICIGTDQRLFTDHDDIAILADDYLLMSGKIAPSEKLSIFIAEVKSQNSFYLKGTQGYLSYDLAEAASPTLWTVQHGMIGTLESAPRYLCYEQEHFSLKPLEEAQANTSFFDVASAPITATNANGARILGGGWTADALAALSFEKIKCLDLTSLDLPIHARAFENYVANTPIFVKAGAQAVVPSSWHFVVACSDVNKLVDNHLTLSDEQPFFTDRDIHVTDGQITYERHIAPTNAASWQTISLPFEAKVVAGKAFALEEVDSQVLTFDNQPASQVESDRGYLICPDSTGTISVSSLASVIRTSANTDNPFRPTYQRLTVQSAASSTYLLHPTLQVFKRANPGSTIRPFRAYISTAPSAAPALSIKWKR